MFDANVHTTNKNNFPPEELAKYAGMCVAWSFDGTQILAAAPTWSGLSREKKRLALTDVIGEYIPAGPYDWLDNYLEDPEAEAAVLAQQPPAGGA